MEALIFWALALYGAILVVYQSVAAILRRTKVGKEIVFFVIAQNAEDYIEGVLRTLVLRALFEQARRRVIVIDVGSTDSTGIITLKITQKYHFVEYVVVNDEETVLKILKSACASSHAIGCIYDLRYQLNPRIRQQQS